MNALIIQWNNLIKVGNVLIIFPILIKLAENAILRSHLKRNNFCNFYSKTWIFKASLLSIVKSTGDSNKNFMKSNSCNNTLIAFKTKLSHVQIFSQVLDTHLTTLPANWVQTMLLSFDSAPSTFEAGFKGLLQIFQTQMSFRFFSFWAVSSVTVCLLVSLSLKKKALKAKSFTALIKPVGQAFWSCWPRLRPL